jgi:hypothetical protein
VRKKTSKSGLNELWCGQRKEEETHDDGPDANNSDEDTLYLGVVRDVDTVQGRPESISSGGLDLGSSGRDHISEFCIARDIPSDEKSSTTKKEGQSTHGRQHQAGFLARRGVRARSGRWG